MRSRIVIFSLLLLVLGSCGPRGLPGIPAGDSFKALSPHESAQFLASQQQVAGQLRTLKVSADVTVSKGVGKRSFLQSFVYDAPDQARIESFVPAVNQLISLVIVNSQLIFVRDNREGSSYIAEPTPENIAKLIHLPLYPADLASFLLGAGVLHKSLDKVTVASTGLGSEEIVRTDFTGDTQRVEQYYRVCRENPREYRLVGLRIVGVERSAELVSASLRYGDSEVGENLGQCGVPRSISLRLADEGLTAEITLKSVRQNEPLKPGLFQIPVQ